MKKSDLEALAFSVEKPRTDMWGDAVAGSVKGEFKRRCLAWLRGLVSDLPKTSYTIKFNPGGVAVSGDAYLDMPDLYIAISANGLGVLYRRPTSTCPRARDAGNMWKSADFLLNEPTPELRKRLCNAMV